MLKHHFSFRHLTFIQVQPSISFLTPYLKCAASNICFIHTRSPVFYIRLEVEPIFLNFKLKSHEQNTIVDAVRDSKFNFYLYTITFIQAIKLKLYYCPPKHLLHPQNSYSFQAKYTKIEPKNIIKSQTSFTPSDAQK